MTPQPSESSGISHGTLPSWATEVTLANCQLTTTAETRHPAGVDRMYTARSPRLEVPFRASIADRPIANTLVVAGTPLGASIHGRAEDIDHYLNQQGLNVVRIGTEQTPDDVLEGEDIPDATYLAHLVNLIPALVAERGYLPHDTPRIAYGVGQAAMQAIGMADSHQFPRTHVVFAEICELDAPADSESMAPTRAFQREVLRGAARALRPLRSGNVSEARARLSSLPSQAQRLLRADQRATLANIDPDTVIHSRDINHVASSRNVLRSWATNNPICFEQRLQLSVRIEHQQLVEESVQRIREAAILTSEGLKGIDLLNAVETRTQDQVHGRHSFKPNS